MSNLPTSKSLLLNLSQCQRLYQEDKFQKQDQEIQATKSYYNSLHQNEMAFYETLNLPSQEKKRLFMSTGKKEEKELGERKENMERFRIVQDPIKGNIVMREEEFRRIQQK
jgi:hypothetical protein